MATITPNAVFPTAGNVFTGGATNPYSGTFIPALWSGKMTDKFYDATVLAAISNTDYEGEIKDFGDQVIIRTKPSIGIRDYHAGNDGDGTTPARLTYEKPTSPTTTLLINKGNYWGTELDDVMEVQSDIDQLSMWADDASEQMKISIDTNVLSWMHESGLIFNGAVAGTGGNRGSAAGRISQDINLGKPGGVNSLVVTKNNITDLIVDAGTVLDEANVPESGRWLVIPAWMAGRIKKSELKDASLTGEGTSILRNGRLGTIDRFTIYMSNLLPSGTGILDNGVDGAGVAGEAAVYFGHSIGMTFASQVTKTETLRVESTFGTIMRGLQVYGHQIVKGDALGEMIVRKS
tara:strand:+ start:6766 stop:7809 length:1044 start_codon:yes stop_codon:yes gene_type:complete